TATTRSARSQLRRATKRRAAFFNPSETVFPSNGTRMGSIFRTITAVGIPDFNQRAVGMKTTSGERDRSSDLKTWNPFHASDSGQLRSDSVPLISSDSVRGGLNTDKRETRESDRRSGRIAGRYFLYPPLNLRLVRFTTATCIRIASSMPEGP